MRNNTIVNFLRNIFSKVYYEIIMTVLALVAVTVTLADFTGKISLDQQSMWYFIDLGILIFFSLDYFSRLFISENKRKFIKMNIFDLLAIVPFNSLFRAFRLARLFRMTKLLKIMKFVKLSVFLKRFDSKSRRFLNTNGLKYIMYLTALVILLGSIGIYYTELGITVDSFGDSLWWSFVTATTVGYGDISPVTGFGRLIASVLMITGIGFIGMLTGSIATFFIKPEEKKLGNYDDLSQDDIEKVNSYIEYLRSRV
ncbi:MAG: potassium channel family protein [Clostridia bacterium]|nr:potassium channel family protein [Clostridia bacterium]